MPHSVCAEHYTPIILQSAFGWYAFFEGASADCVVCANPILAEVYDLEAGDLAEVYA